MHNVYKKTLVFFPRIETWQWIGTAHWSPPCRRSDEASGMFLGSCLYKIQESVPKRKLQLRVQLLEILVCFTEIRQENEHRHLLRNNDLSSPSKSSQLGSKLMENARFLWASPRKDRSFLKTAGRFMVKRFRSAHVLDSNLISGNFRLGMCCNTHRDSRRAGELNLKWWSCCDVFRIIG